MSSGAQAGWHAPTINSKRLAHFERKLSSLASCHEYEMDGISGAVGPARPTPQTTLLRTAPIGPRVLAASHNDTRNPLVVESLRKGKAPQKKVSDEPFKRRPHLTRGEEWLRGERRREINSKNVAHQRREPTKTQNRRRVTGAHPFATPAARMQYSQWVILEELKQLGLKWADHKQDLNIQ